MTDKLPDYILDQLQKEFSEADPHLNDPVIPEFSMTLDFSKEKADITIKNIPMPLARKLYRLHEAEACKGLNFDNGIEGRTIHTTMDEYEDITSALLEDAIDIGVREKAKTEIIVHPSSLVAK